jgi:IS30 family transposase
VWRDRGAAQAPCLAAMYLDVDNGKDMVEHPRIAAGRNAQVYFAHPYAAWERDTTENPFGLLVSTFLSSAT